MAELTKDDIKEALGFIEGFQKIFGNLGNAASAIAVLGQLKASVDSLTAKGEKLRKEIASLDGQKAVFAKESAEQKKALEIQRIAALNGIEAAADVARREARAKFDEAAVAFAEDLEKLGAEKTELLEAISDLSKRRDGILLGIEALKSNQTAEQSRLDAILAKIAELKSRL